MIRTLTKDTRATRDDYGIYVGYSNSHETKVIFEIKERYWEESYEAKGGYYNSIDLRGVSKLFTNDIMFNINKLLPITDCRKLTVEDLTTKFIDLYTYRIDMKGKGYKELVNNHIKYLDPYINSAGKILLP